MNKVTKVLAVVGAGILLLGAGAYAGSQIFPKTVEVQKEVFVDKIVIVEKEVPVEITKEVIVTEAVDNGNLDKVMTFVEDNFDEDITVEYIMFETDALMEAESYIRSNMISLLDDNDYFDSNEVLDPFRKSEVSISKINDAEVIDRDFENKDVSFVFDVKVKAKESGEDSIYNHFEVTIPFEDGKIVEDDIEVSLI